MMDTEMRVVLTAAKDCPRCGRPIRRGPKARWCSESCRVMAWQKRRQRPDNRSEGTRTPLRPAESTGTRNLRGLLTLWERALGEVTVPQSSMVEESVRKVRAAFGELACALDRFERR